MRMLFVFFFVFMIHSFAFSQENNLDTNQEWQFFRVNAQYRGAIKKSFVDIGCALIWFNELSPDKIQVITHFCALNPEKSRQKFVFRLNMIYKHSPTSFQTDSEIYSQFIGIDKRWQEQLKQLVALWSYMRQVEKTSTVISQFDADGIVLNLHDNFIRRRQSREVSCSWTGNRNFSGKFFFDFSSDKKYQLAKLRFRHRTISISLVRDQKEKIIQKFLPREPFATDVFR